MKKCPKCSRVFDDLQSFCLEDGTPLAVLSAANSQETVVLPRKNRKSVLPFAFGGLLLLTAALIGGWFLLGSKPNNVSQINRQTEVNIQPTVSTPTPTPFETPPTFTPTPTISPEAKSDVSTNSISINPETTPDSSDISIPADEPAPAKPLPVIMKAEDHSVLFALHECRKSGSSITCQFSLTNKGQDRRFKIYGYQSKLFDELGNSYRCSEIQIANQTGNGPEIGFINGVTTRAQMTFGNVEPNAAKITLLDVGFVVGRDYDLSVKFRNVPLIVSK